MIPVADMACAVLLSWNAMVAATPAPPAVAPDSMRTVPRLTFEMDTVRKARPKAIVYSDRYEQRLTWHRRLSWAMLPLFAVSYFSGNELLTAAADGRPAKSWARDIHGPAATSTAVLFGANALTGSLNLWEGRHDPNGRTRRFVHSALFTLASGGFAYTGVKLANDAEQSQDKRQQHRNMAIASMGVSTVSWLIMLLGN